jgi:hypothetical protein
VTRPARFRSAEFLFTHVPGVTVALLIPNQLVRVRILGDVLHGRLSLRESSVFRFFREAKGDTYFPHDDY